MHVGLLKPFLWYACFSPSWVLLRAHWPGGCSSWWQFGRNTVYWNGRDILCPRNFDALIPGSTMTRSNSSLFLWVLFDREENGNPLQCSCLENPRDGGAWWAAVCGVTQSQTQPKRLSSSIIFWCSTTWFIFVFFSQKLLHMQVLLLPLWNSPSELAEWLYPRPESSVKDAD